MSKNTQTRTVKISINLPMKFPEDWDDNMINFHLNDSSWCWSNIIDELNEYAKSSGGCICGICSGEVEQNKNDYLPCKSCSSFEKCKMFLNNPKIKVRCIWYDLLKNNICKV